MTVQLHHLTLSAIGPFDSEFHIDFSALGASGLFLLEGPTGSGKSTIIDAIVYALYGKVASAEASEDRMRSDHAADTQESYVDLIFETSHGIFRVVRQPERMRPKRRGEGLTKQQAKITLFRLSVADLEQINTAYHGGAGHEEINDLQVGEARSTRLDEVGAEIVHAIGLDRAQFSQTIVLPQGEFAKFLRAEPEHRRALLQKVFGTEIYERAQTELAAMRVEASKAIAAGDGTRRDAIRAFTQTVENAELQADTLVGLSDQDLHLTLTQEVERLAAVEAAATDAELQAVTTETAAQSSFVSGQQRVSLHQQRLAVEREKAELEENRAAHEEASHTYEQAVRASYVLPALDAQSAAATEQGNALNAFVSSVEQAQQFAELGPIQGDLHEASKSTLQVFARTFRENRESLVEQRDRAQHTIGQLQQIESLERDLPHRRKALETLSAKADQFAATAQKVRAQLAERPDELADLTAERDNHAKSAGALPAHERDIARLEQQSALHRAAQESEHKVAVAKDRVEDAARTVAAESDREHALRRSWLSQLAAVVATELKPGEPCQVCGSLEHPAPAQPDPESATEEQVAKAESSRKKAEAALSKAQVDQAAAQERFGVLSEQLGDGTLEQTLEELEHARGQHELAQTAAAALKRLNLAILEHQAATQKLVAHDKALASDSATNLAKIEENTAAVERDQTLVRTALDEYSNEIAEFADAPHELTAAVLTTYLAHRVTAIAQLLGSLDAFNVAERNSEARSRELSDALREHNFSTATEARDVALPAKERDLLNARITAYTQRWAAVTTQLASPQFAELPVELDVDLDALRTQYSEAQFKARQATHVANTAKKIHKEATYRLHEIERVVESLRAERARVAPIIRMADIANGNSSDNPKRITLATYVLMRRFEDVVSAANTCLSALSDGRYELVRSDEKEDVRSQKRGLALKVIDHDTDKARDPRTLSGGETFNASLSLALGLADVVTGEAGGVELGTLFIDEGFGTLDPDALERVISVLSDLRDGGRTVGVVSHVETLKQSIPDGISVRRLPSGASTLEVRA